MMISSETKPPVEFVLTVEYFCGAVWFMCVQSNRIYKETLGPFETGYMADQESKARDIAKTLQEAGHVAFYAGGCVRDELLGLKPKDFDIATSAHPDVVEGLFRRTMALGKQFGVIVVMIGSDAFDVATFRKDFDYGDGRHPEKVSFSSAEEDVARRDFTINGLLKDPISGVIHDYVGGQDDLAARLIRTIGEPEERFGEDYLRLLRAHRFAARLGFQVEEKTKRSLKALAPKAAMPSAERKRDELEKMLTEGHPAHALSLLEETGTLEAVLPDVASSFAEILPDRLRADAGTTRTVGDRVLAIFRELDGTLLKPELAWAHLLADITTGFPAPKARHAMKMLHDLRVSKNLSRDVGELIRIRDRLLFAKRVSVARKGIVRAHDDPERLVGFGLTEARFSQSSRGFTGEPTQCVPLPSPLLRGDELIKLGAPRGPALGRIVRQLRFRQLQGICKTPDDAREWVSGLFS